MKVLAFKSEGRHGVGALTDQEDAVVPFALSEEAAKLGVLALLEADPVPAPAGDPLALSHLKVLAPLPRPRRNIFCVGKNYHDHAVEFSRSGFDSGAAVAEVPKEPIIFSKVPETVISHRTPIRFDPSVSQAIDYEAELAVVIGKGGRGISRERALDHVWGYTIINDVTARDLQRRHSQWLVGKSLDTFCPMGPMVVTRDEVDLTDTSLRCWVNGALRQNTNTKQLIFDVPKIIETLSAGVTLLPGDVIATGTPSGVGIGFDPPKYLKAGDVVTVSIQNIGTLENPVEELSA